LEGGDGAGGGVVSCRLQVVQLQVVGCGLWGGEGGPGFLGYGFRDDGWRGAGVCAFGERGGGEEFGVATGAVAGAEEVEEAFFADGDGGWSCRLRVAGCRLDRRGGRGLVGG